MNPWRDVVGFPGVSVRWGGFENGAVMIDVNGGPSSCYRLRDLEDAASRQRPLGPSIQFARAVLRALTRPDL